MELCRELEVGSEHGRGACGEAGQSKPRDPGREFKSIVNLRLEWVRRQWSGPDGYRHKRQDFSKFSTQAGANKDGTRLTELRL